MIIYNNGPRLFLLKEANHDSNSRFKNDGNREGPKICSIPQDSLPISSAMRFSNFGPHHSEKTGRLLSKTTNQKWLGTFRNIFIFSYFSFHQGTISSPYPPCFVLHHNFHQVTLLASSTILSYSPLYIYHHISIHFKRGASLVSYMESSDSW